MANLLFAIVCTPFCVVANMLNIVFIFCLCQPVEGVSIHQPLYFLLTVMLGNSTVQQLIIMVYVILTFLRPPDWLLIVNLGIIYQTYCSSFSTCAWISIFYYLKIVPQHHAFFIWIKKNIKVIVFAGFVLDQVLLLSAITMGTVSNLPQPTYSSNNTTFLDEVNALNRTLFKMAIRVFLAYFVCPFCILTFSWGKTFNYLRGHIRRMEQTTGSQTTSPQQQNQMRVTITGIVQTSVFVPSSLCAITTALLFFHDGYLDRHITMTMTSISGLANILCLGFSQSIFRVRVVSLLKRFYA
ncbi:taste receptor type 2 member 7 [Trichomycterus rosablanca]|uniref:taste receptor type 2 member 7 n=1 Tax=Trichomycterus rosablanca TaxID=2290929 RepID=UPI002F35B016